LGWLGGPSQFWHPQVPYWEDEQTGTMVLPNTKTMERRCANGELIYEAKYSTGACGIRLTDNEGTLAADPATLLLLGCSWTFGMGVADDQTFGAILEHVGAGRLRTVNWGVPGGGAHSALAQLESGRDREVLGTRRPIAVVYVAIPDHVLRANGQHLWMEGHARYRLVDGRAHRDGLFGCYTVPFGWRPCDNFGEWYYYNLSKSSFLSFWPAFWHTAVEWHGNHWPDHKLYLAMLFEIARIAKESYQAPLLIFASENSAAFVAARDQGLDVVTMPSDISTFPFDGHPTPQGHAVIARTIFQSMKDRSLWPPAAPRAPH